MNFINDFFKPYAFLWILAITSLSLFSGCHTIETKTPEWVQNPYSLYPESEYLVSVGKGNTCRAAENAADKNLSQILNAHTNSTEFIHETGETFSRTNAYISALRHLSPQTPLNIQHAETWIDETACVHTIAYLNRQETAKLYCQLIEEKNERILLFLAHAKGTNNRLKIYANLRAAACIALENEFLLSQLRIIHPASASAVMTTYDANALYHDLADTAQKTGVQIKINGDTDKRITAVTEELIADYGFVIGTPATLHVIGSVNITNITCKDKLDYLHYSLNLQIADAAAHILISINKQGKEAKNAPTEVREQVYRTLENIIKTSGAQQLNAYFKSLTDQTAK